MTKNTHGSCLQFKFDFHHHQERTFVLDTEIQTRLIPE